MARDYYDVLGVGRSASEQELKAAYHKLALQFHPDRNPGDKKAEARFKELQQAYAVLADKEKKQLYDQYGEAGVSGRPHPGQGRAGGGFGGFQEVDPSQFADMFRQFNEAGFGNVDVEQIFGTARRGQPKSSPKREVRADIEVPFKTAMLGGTLPVQINDRAIDVKIPPGVEDGGKLRVSGQGPGGSDLILRLHVQPHPHFRREGSDLVLAAPISITEAALGATIEVPTLDGRLLAVKVPPGASSGTRLRLRGRGANGGDQYVELSIQVSPATDPKSRELMEEYGRLNPQRPREGLW